VSVLGSRKKIEDRNGLKFVRRSLEVQNKLTSPPRSKYAERTLSNPNCLLAAALVKLR